LALKIRGVPPRQIRKEVTEVLRWVGLPQKIGSLTRRLSGGEQQRVAIARAIVTNPSILLADEPTGNLDQEISLEIMEMFRRLNSRGTTILVASHNQMLLERYARNVLYLKKGTSISLRRVAQ